MYLISVATRSPKKAEPFDLAGFGQIPISFGGRQQPLDSLARNHLKVISGKEEWYDGKGKERTGLAFLLLGKDEGKKQPPTQWLLDVFTRQAGGHKVFRIDDPGIKAILAKHITPAPGEDPVVKRKMFGPVEMGGAFPELTRQIGLAEKVAPRDRDMFQRSVIDLSRQIASVGQLSQVQGLFFVPPAGGSQEWRTVGEMIDEAKGDPANVHPLVRSLFTMFDAYGRNDPATFNAEVKNYRAMVEQSVPAVVAISGFRQSIRVEEEDITGLQ